jgi:hypothetical protein
MKNLKYWYHRLFNPLIINIKFESFKNLDQLINELESFKLHFGYHYIFHFKYEVFEIPEVETIEMRCFSKATASIIGIYCSKTIV